MGPPALAAISSREGSVTELTTCTVPNSAAASAEAQPPSGAKTWSEPMGASITGMRMGWSRKVVEGSVSETSTRTRGRKARRSKARRLRRMVVSDSDPPTR